LKGFGHDDVKNYRAVPQRGKNFPPPPPQNPAIALSISMPDGNGTAQRDITDFAGEGGRKEDG
jgi:hypothetical protein